MNVSSEYRFLLFYYEIHLWLRSKSITLLRIFDVIPTPGLKERLTRIVSEDMLFKLQISNQSFVERFIFSTPANPLTSQPSPFRTFPMKAYGTLGTEKFRFNYFSPFSNFYIPS